VFNNDRKVRLIKEKVHGLQYAPGSIRMPAFVKRQNGQLGLMVLSIGSPSPAD
jgi:hypothetical protein